MKTLRQKAFERCSKEICSAMFYNGLSENALQWPILEVVTGCKSFGSGESTQFGGKCLVRLDGKQIYVIQPN